MKREANGSALSAVFVDYDNIYLSLRRKSEEAARRFSRDAALWVRGIESGALITPTNGPAGALQRRLVMSRCYGNPVPRRNAGDNSTDMNSFPFVRHHFLRAGFEIIDCPPLTAQLKNSSDIRMVMDVRDLLDHDTYYDEFIILSGDADFTPVLHRLRSHARRTVIFANDHTAAPYTAICDGEVRESDLLQLLLGDAVPDESGQLVLSRGPQLEQIQSEIMADVVQNVRRSTQPLPLEVLAERATRALGHDKTIGTDWAGAGSFRDLLARALPSDVRMTDEPPYLVVSAAMIAPRAAPANPAREPMQREPMQREQVQRDQMQREPLAREPMRETAPRDGGSLAIERAAPPPAQPALRTRPAVGTGFVNVQTAPPVRASAGIPARAPASDQPTQPPPAREPYRRTAAAEPTRAQVRPEPVMERAAPLQPPPVASAGAIAAPPMLPAAPAAAPAMTAADRQAAETAALQQSIARIHDACQAPPLSPPEYRALFETMAAEIGENGLQGSQTLANIQLRAQDMGLKVQRDDIRFVLDVVGESDPWFEQGASSSLFAGRFRNFVVARCRSQGLALSAEELDLIEAWFAGGPPPGPNSGSRVPRPGPTPEQMAPGRPAIEPPRGANWWASDQPAAMDQGGQPPGRASFGNEASALAGEAGDDEFPRIIRRNRA